MTSLTLVRSLADMDKIFYYTLVAVLLTWIKMFWSSTLQDKLAAGGQRLRLFAAGALLAATFLPVLVRAANIYHIEWLKYVAFGMALVAAITPWAIEMKLSVDGGPHND
jgi:hypothetical protein